MSRLRPADEAQVSLFPFLAVLLCTMGTLVVVFVLVAQKTTDETAPQTVAAASVVADSENATPDSASTLDDEYAAALVRTNAATLDEIVSETETLAWFGDELDGVQSRSQASLEKERERLAAAEKAVAQILADSDALRRKLEALAAEPSSANGDDAAALQAKSAELDREIERLRAELEKARAENAEPKRSFAIVPYQGKKGTFRRPIFIECNERGVFLQPEGVPFAPGDFLLAKYPGNPFDAGIRAAARRLTETNGERTADGAAFEPYPLLIVRPGGAGYYYPAVAALASWGGVYGYEFVADDEEIEYPAPDPTLAAAVREQAEIARVRLAAAFAEATSVRAAVGSNPFGGSSSGPGGGSGFFGGGGAFSEAAIGGSALQSRLGGAARFGSNGAKLSEARPAGNGNAAANGFAGNGNGAGGDDSTPLPQYVGEFSQFVVAPNGSGGGNGGEIGTGAAAQNSGNGVENGNGTGAVAQDFGSGNGAASNGGNVAFVPNAAASPQAVDGSNAASSGLTPFWAEFQAPSSNPNPTASTETPKIDPRQTLGNSTFAAGATGSTDSGTLVAGNGATTSRIEPVERPEKDDAPTERKAIRLSDEMRRPATAGIERGVSVRVAADKLVFPKQPGLRRAVEVAPDAGAPLSSKESELLDALVLCVKSWGVAGRNMYWAPFLKIEVAPNGEARFRELAEFCRAQGLPFVRADADGSTD